jgi:hypothetical protein
MPTLDEDDKATAIALMVRLLRIQSERDRLQEIKKEVDEKSAASQLQWTRCRDAFAILGFDTSHTNKELWNEIKAAISPQEWNAAFERAKAKPIPQVPITSALPPPRPLPPPWVGKTEEKTEDEAEPEELTDFSFEGVEEPPQSVREFVLDALKTKAAEGARAAEIRTSYEAARNTKLHDKTIGMTLYRLSKDNLVRRDGRTWFYVPLVESGTKNPGVGAPGNIEDLWK